MGQAKINRSNKPKPEADRSAKDATERHQRSRLCAWNPFSRKLKPTCFIPIWRKWRKSDKRSTSRELPPEIIREILIRLPVRSIGRSRCVSKLFRSLSSDPGFAKSQLGLTVHRKLIVSSHETYSLDMYSIGGGGGSEVTQDRDGINVELIYPLKSVISLVNKKGEIVEVTVEQNRGIWVQLVGSSNGLVCISPHEDEDVVSLYNPTTKESKLLLPQSVPSRYRENFQSYGFGFDHLTDDYKVVKLVSDRHNFLYACVYSLKSNSWRRICDLNYQRINRSRRPGVNLNGVIHWVVFTRGNHKQRLILAFDIITEEFREMPFPDEEAEDRPNSFKDFVVGNLNERLCVVNSCRELLHDDIWVMNEFGVASSWTRIRISLLYIWMKPVCSTKNSEEVVLGLDGDMVLYNFETHAWRKIQGVKLQQGFDANTYVESLVSPNLYGFDN